MALVLAKAGAQQTVDVEKEKIAKDPKKWTAEWIWENSKDDRKAMAALKPLTSEPRRGKRGKIIPAKHP